MPSEENLSPAASGYSTSSKKDVDKGEATRRRGYHRYLLCPRVACFSLDVHVDPRSADDQLDDQKDTSSLGKCATRSLSFP